MPKNEAQKRYLEAKRAVENGEKIAHAVKAAGSSMGYWYKQKAKNSTLANAPLKRPYKRTKFIDLPQSLPGKVAIIVCDPSQLNSILAGLK